MKKHSLLPGIVSIVALLAIVGALLFPLGAGLVAKGTFVEAARGYDFVFGNDALQINNPYGSMIAWFVLLLIAAFFGLVGSVTGFFGGKVGAFFDFVAGLIAVVCAILFFLSPVMVGNSWVSAFNTAEAGVTANLGWGFIAAGASSAVAAVLNLFVGGKGLFSKKA